MLRSHGLQLDARGNCMNRNASQTVGGVLATNVHHSDIRTFADIAIWVDVVLADGSLRRSRRGEELFMLTVGGGGQTGVIVRAGFDVVPRGVYEDQGFLSGLASRFKNYEPMERLLSGSAFVKVDVPYDAATVGSIDWSTETVERKSLMDIDGIIVDTESYRAHKSGYRDLDFEIFYPTSLRSRLETRCRVARLPPPPYW